MPSYNAARYKRRCSGRKNIIAAVAVDRRRMDDRETFDYKTKGMMASIGKRTGIGNLLGIVYFKRA
jgi:NADH dehydrogenase FAD-containing subunit